VTTAAFADPGIPTGYAPFGIQNVGGTIFVTYALQDEPGMTMCPGRVTGSWTRSIPPATSSTASRRRMD
jgi:hypothetical protein